MAKAPPNPFPLGRLEVAPGDYENWGKLLKCWARLAAGQVPSQYPVGEGPAYLSAAATPKTLPTTMKELVAQAKKAGVKLTIPARFNDFEVEMKTGTKLEIYLPPPGMIDAAEHYLQAPGTDYLLPAFYDSFYVNPRRKKMTEAEKLAFHAKRIGDYTIANCQ